MFWRRKRGRSAVSEVGAGRSRSGIGNAGPAVENPAGTGRAAAGRAGTDMIRSTTFRLALGYTLLFSASVLLLFLGVYTGTTKFAEQQIRAAIQADITALAEQYQRYGAPGLQTLIERRVNARPTSPELYLLANRNGSLLAGNLSGWPDAVVASDGWLTFSLGIEPDSASAVGGHKRYRALARPFALQGGFRLLVGRDLEQLDSLALRLRNGFLLGLGLTGVLAVLGGWYFSQRVSRRIERMNIACQKIMAGELSQRIPRDQTQDEFDALAGNINAMLSRIESAVGDVRRVSDNIAHDLRTPLARLRTRLELAGRQSPGECPEIAAALKEADQLLDTFNALLRIARIEAGERRAGFAPVDITAVAFDVAELYEPVLEENRQTLKLQISRGINAVGDRDLLFQALANLLDNAHKYAPANSEVRLTLTEQNGWIRFAVIDQGPGIPEADQQRVQQRFQRLEESRSSPGVGLGLSLVKAVAELHGGQLRLAGCPGLCAELLLPAT